MEGDRGLTLASSLKTKTGEREKQALQMAVAAFHGSLQQYSQLFLSDTNTTSLDTGKLSLQSFEICCVAM